MLRTMTLRILRKRRRRRMRIRFINTTNNKKKTKKSLSGKYLLQQLENYYKDQPETAKEVTQHLLSNREETIKEDIRRKINK